MKWQRLDRDTSQSVINSVQSDGTQGMFALGTSEVQRAFLPFYQGYFLYQVTNYASLPSFSFQYLSDGKFFHYLDGTEEPIYKVNDGGALVLNEATILAYLDFYLKNVGDEDGDIILINDPHDMPLLDSLGPAEYQAVFQNHQPVTIDNDPANQVFTINATLYMESQLVRAKILITTRGRVTISGQKMIRQDVITTDMAESFM